jgi:type I restriction enzyme M protein
MIRHQLLVLKCLCLFCQLPCFLFSTNGGENLAERYELKHNTVSLSYLQKILLTGKGDIPDIIERFRKRYEENLTDRKGKCFFVPFNEIKENGYDLSISKYKEIVYEEVQYEKPNVILEKIEDLRIKLRRISLS